MTDTSPPLSTQPRPTWSLVTDHVIGVQRPTPNFKTPLSEFGPLSSDTSTRSRFSKHQRNKLRDRGIKSDSDTELDADVEVEHDSALETVLLTLLPRLAQCQARVCVAHQRIKIFSHERAVHGHPKWFEGKGMKEDMCQAQQQGRLRAVCSTGVDRVQTIYTGAKSVFKDSMSDNSPSTLSYAKRRILRYRSYRRLYVMNKAFRVEEKVELEGADRKAVIMVVETMLCNSVPTIADGDRNNIRLIF
ncbi:hypothetical protein BJ165DRAFT_1405564 [Panaeolus papilionaceus]|nr:hypothetical protein BJ165DRAFT_1405564 [Panaeolus papilionaceus]